MVARQKRRCADKGQIRTDRASGTPARHANPTRTRHRALPHLLGGSLEAINTTREEGRAVNGCQRVHASIQNQRDSTVQAVAQTLTVSRGDFGVWDLFHSVKRCRREGELAGSSWLAQKTKAGRWVRTGGAKRVEPWRGLSNVMDDGQRVGDGVGGC